MRFEDQLGVQMFAAAHLRAEDRVARAKAACTFKDYTFYIRRLFQNFPLGKKQNDGLTITQLEPQQVQVKIKPGNF
jgi:hypothetical protein